MIVYLKDFTLTGKFGPVEIGNLKIDIIRSLGQPDEDLKLLWGSEIVYGRYELFFDDRDILHGIQNDSYYQSDPLTYEFKNSVFEIEPWFFRRDVWPTFRDIESILSRESFLFSRANYAGRAILKLSSGVYIDFEEEPENIFERPLVGLRYWPEKL
ncbi:MAG: hypothetical protein AAF974_08075 [Cyanobacteria bacterium P01_E01_bin.34]